MKIIDIKYFVLAERYTVFLSWSFCEVFFFMMGLETIFGLMGDSSGTDISGKTHLLH